MLIREWIMIKLLSFCLLQMFVAQASLTDGQSVSGDLQNLSSEQVVFKIRGEDRTFSASELDEITLSRRSSALGLPVIRMVDGSMFSAKELRISKQGQVNLQLASGRMDAFDAASIQTLRFFAETEGELWDQWQEIVESQGREDFLVVNKRGNLDYLAGVVGIMDVNALEFVYGGSSISVPRERVAGVVFAKRPAPDASARATVTTTDGGVWNVRSLSSTDSSLQLTTVGGNALQFPLGSVHKVKFLRLGVVYLTDLEPEAVDVRPYFASKALTEELKTLFSPRRDQSYSGESLQVVGSDGENRVFERGLAMQSHSEMTYRLARKYQRFQATVGIDPSAVGQGNVSFQVFGDDAEIFTRTVAHGEPAVEVDVPIANANRLRIVVGFGKNLDIGDRLHLGGAKFVKK